MTDLADVEAMVDVLDRLTEKSDSLPLGEAVELDEALGDLIAVARRCQSMVNTAALGQVEKAKTVNGVRYVRTPVYKKRFQHVEIARRILDRVKVNRETGEIKTVEEAVTNALRIALKIWCSDSTAAKVGELRRQLGVADAVEEGLAVEHQTSYELKAYPLEEPCSDAS